VVSHKIPCLPKCLRQAGRLISFGMAKASLSLRVPLLYIVISSPVKCGINSARNLTQACAGFLVAALLEMTALEEVVISIPMQSGEKSCQGPSRFLVTCSFGASFLEMTREACVIFPKGSLPRRGPSDMTIPIPLCHFDPRCLLAGKESYQVLSRFLLSRQVGIVEMTREACVISIPLLSSGREILLCPFKISRRLPLRSFASSK
jgi:hypothetical protein